MHRNGYRKVCGFLFLALAIAGCGVQRPDGDQYTVGDGHAWPGIDGYVTEYRGGPARAGIRVNLYRITGTTVGTYLPNPMPVVLDQATTDNSGYFSFTDLSPGIYTLEVDPTVSRAGARYQHLVFNGDNHLRADLIVPPSFLTSPTTQLPSIGKVEVGGLLLEAGKVLSGQVTMNINIVPGTYDTKLILVKVGHLSNGSDFVSDNCALTSTASFALDTRKFSNGPSFIYVISYDFNDNNVSMMIPVTFTN